MGEDIVESSPVSFSEQFKKAFPFYLAIGMTASQFWDEDCLLAKYYREAYTLKQEMQNQQSWLNGFYVYSAVSAVVGSAISTKKSTDFKYPEKPIEFKPEKESNKEEQHYTAQKTQFEMLVAALNRKFKGGDES